MDLGWVFWLIVAGGVLVLLFASNVLLWLVALAIKLAVAIKASRRPPHVDVGNYRLDQGREVREERRSE